MVVLPVDVTVPVVYGGAGVLRAALPLTFFYRTRDMFICDLWARSAVEFWRGIPEVV